MRSVFLPQRNTPHARRYRRRKIALAFAIALAYNQGMANVDTAHIELPPNRDGQQRALQAGTRVRVQDVYVIAALHGQTRDVIVRSLPHLLLAQVHAALAYYFEHSGDILQELREDEDMVQQFRAMTGPEPVEQEFQPNTDTNRDTVSS